MFVIELVKKHVPMCSNTSRNFTIVNDDMVFLVISVRQSSNTRQPVFMKQSTEAMQDQFSAAHRKILSVCFFDFRRFPSEFYYFSANSFKLCKVDLHRMANTLLKLRNKTLNWGQHWGQLVFVKVHNTYNFNHLKELFGSRRLHQIKGISR